MNSISQGNLTIECKKIAITIETNSFSIKMKAAQESQQKNKHNVLECKNSTNGVGLRSAFRSSFDQKLY